MTFPMAKKLVIGVIALGTVSLGTGGMAGAADPPVTTTKGHGHHVNCARASKVLARIEVTEARIAAGLPQLHAAASRAVHRGDQARADRINKRIGRMEAPAFKARLEKRKAKIQAACPGVTPPPTARKSSVTA